MFGYMGKILRINLTKKTITDEFPDENTLRKYLGGVGLASKYLIDEVPKGVNPLGPENKLIFATGPLSGTPSPSTGRFSVVAKSPLTGIWGHANSAGFWGRDLKRAGVDGIIFEGISEKPVYLVIEDGKPEIRDASHLWGKNTSETTKIIREELGEKFNVACIGIGGENLVKYAAIMNDVDGPNYGRAAGRCGLGAVMGSKKLKAIAVKGSAKIEVAKKEEYRKAAKQRYDWVEQSLLKMTLETYGTLTVLDMTNVQGGLPTRNWQTGVFHAADKINGEAVNESILVERKKCFACPIACGRIVELKSEKYASKGEGPEYESVGAFGPMCDVDDIEAITYAHFLCNEYGIDTISCGGTIAFAMECFEKGFLTTEQTDGVALNFGNADAMIEMIHKIAKREGAGDFFAEGSKHMAEKIGNDTKHFAMHVKGLDLPAYDSRAAKITGLAYATANRGGCHITAYIEGPTFLSMPFLIVDDVEIADILQENPDEARIVKEFEDAFGVFDAIGGCKFMGMVLTGDDWAELVLNLMGWEDFTTEEFRKTGERIYNLARMFNIREGITRKDDTLPPRLLKDPMPEGPAEGHVVNLDPLLDAYYDFRGWNKETGKPSPEKLTELGLEWLINEL